LTRYKIKDESNNFRVVREEGVAVLLDIHCAHVWISRSELEEIPEPKSLSETLPVGTVVMRTQPSGLVARKFDLGWQITGIDTWWDEVPWLVDGAYVELYKPEEGDEW
jgi:hypothetical protein